ncbi:hypothetical protein SAMN05892883_3243 [Jatrophihabitans sp. GAS493]|uniref:hypothetical protein n=1 Tax=Jatrophihabitans sp. GAS493 TaxID=1907575 RepID=UPI000BB760B3|nr:hypothetical protein [Jatrophihabitans sp. GAS493]SOD74067.1 hypothetical protein SAMN05892883_3243 [Jatrophihabitans sp. GAS493]
MSSDLDSYDGPDDDWEADEEFARRHPYVDGGWGRTANPNTVEGELQNMQAFGNGLTRLEDGQRRFAVIVVWLILIGFAISLGYGVVAIFRLW